MKTLPKYELYAHARQPVTYLEKDLCEDGDWVKKEDLVEWLRMHLHKGDYSEVYLDLLKQLGG